MPVFDIEMLWDCRFCPDGKRNGGLGRHCRNCGHPKDDKDREYMPDNITVADALEGDKKRRAEAGPDWKCLYCASLQNPLNKCCTECGVPQGESAKKEWEAPAETATFDPLSGSKLSSEVHTERVQVLHAASVDDPPPEPKRDTPTKAYADRDSADDIPIPKLGMSSLVRTLIAAPCILLAALLLWFLFRTKIVDVHVSVVSWSHSVKIDRYQVYHRDGWDPDPSAFDVHDQGSRIHHYDHVKVGHHNEPKDEPYDCRCKTVRGTCTTTKVTCTPNKNGTARCSGGDRVCDPDTTKCDTCTKSVDHWVDDFEEQPRYQDYYDWNVWDWGYNRTVAHSGTTTEESWPADVELQPLQLKDGEREREAGRSMDHQVVLTDVKGSSWNLTPDTCNEFERYPVGGHWRIKVGFAHGIEVLP